MTALLHRVQSHIPVVVLGDMNAQVGTVQSESIHGFRPDKETFTGTCFHAFLMDHSLWLPSTGEHTHEGDSTTWISPAGQHFRLDFVCVPICWKQFRVRS